MQWWNPSTSGPSCSGQSHVVALCCALLPPPFFWEGVASLYPAYIPPSHPLFHRRSVEQLSGGELQRLALALTLVQNSDAYLFDEPSSYLDIAQRMRAARAIRACADQDT